jgi:hypothetical protein
VKVLQQEAAMAGSEQEAARNKLDEAVAQAHQLEFERDELTRKMDQEKRQHDEHIRKEKARMEAEEQEASCRYGRSIGKDREYKQSASKLFKLLTQRLPDDHPWWRTFGEVNVHELQKLGSLCRARTGVVAHARGIVWLPACYIAANGVRLSCVNRLTRRQRRYGCYHVRGAQPSTSGVSSSLSLSGRCWLACCPPKRRMGRDSPLQVAGGHLV